jgi:hypothetical protein
MANVESVLEERSALVGDILHRINPAGMYAQYMDGKGRWRESASIRNDVVEKAVVANLLGDDRGYSAS